MCVRTCTYVSFCECVCMFYGCDSITKYYNSGYTDVLDLKQITMGRRARKWQFAETFEKQSQIQFQTARSSFESKGQVKVTDRVTGF